MAARSDREFLLQGAMLQDHLLQAYRSIHVTLQSILLAVGIGVWVVSISSSTFPKPSLQGGLATILLAALWILQCYINRKMRGLVLARGDDVSHWHRKLILAEQQLPAAERHFTAFKIYQQARRQNVEHLQKLMLGTTPIAESDVDLLIDKGLGHTRHVIDKQLSFGAALIWGAIGGSSVLFAVSGWVQLIVTWLNLAKR